MEHKTSEDAKTIIMHGVAGIIFDSAKNKFLILKRQGAWVGWQFVQGRIDGEETPEQAVIREIQEETGLKTIEIAKKLPFSSDYWFTAEGGRVHKFLDFFLVNSDMDENITLSEEHSDYKWVNFEEALGSIKFNKDIFKKVPAHLGGSGKNNEPNIPSIEECYRLMDEYHVPANVRKHSEQVRKVAVFVAEKLKEKNIDINIRVVEAAALLHDLTRASNFKDFSTQKDAPPEDVEFWKKMGEKHGDVDHAETGADALLDKYPEVAEAIRAHGVELKIKWPNLNWEQKVLAYADVRVLHDKIVSMQERFEDSKVRHGQFFEKKQEETGVDYRGIMMKNMINIENEIFSIIDEKPEDLNKL